jgi:hypothetical protein
MSLISVTVTQLVVGEISLTPIPGGSSVSITPIISETLTVRQIEAGPPGPGGLGPETSTIEASEAIEAGQLLNVWVDAGELRVRPALGVFGREAHGFSLSNISMGSDVTVYHGGENSAMSGLTVGAQFLSPTVPGACQAAIPTAPGHLVQKVGFASSATRLIFTEGLPVLLS